MMNSARTTELARSAAKGASPCPGYAPIASYCFLADGRTCALLSGDYSVEWMCAPRFDGPSAFAAILDNSRGGSFSLHPPQAAARHSRRYLPETNVLETTWSHALGLYAEELTPDGQLLGNFPQGVHSPEPDPGCRQLRCRRRGRGAASRLGHPADMAVSAPRVGGA